MVIGTPQFVSECRGVPTAIIAVGTTKTCISACGLDAGVVPPSLIFKMRGGMRPSRVVKADPYRNPHNITMGLSKLLRPRSCLTTGEISPLGLYQMLSIGHQQTLPITLRVMGSYSLGAGALISFIVPWKWVHPNLAPRLVSNVIHWV